MVFLLHMDDIRRRINEAIDSDLSVIETHIDVWLLIVI